MRRDLGFSLFALLSFVALFGGCQRASVAVYNVPKETASTPSSVATDSETSTAGDGWINWTKPAAWTELPPTAFRKGNFVYEGSDGDTVEITVSSFPGDVGGTLANVNRWRGQAGLPPITNEALSKSLTEISVEGHDGQLVNILPDSSDPGAVQIVAAIFLYKGESWFFKMSGPQKLVASQKETFDRFIRELQFTDAETRKQEDAANDKAGKQTLVFEAPEGWKLSEGSSLRIASYEVALEGFEPADFSITSFPGDAGGIEANVNRWRQQIGLRPWSESQVESNKEPLQVGDLEFALFDLRPRTEAEKERVKERILAAILKHDGRSWFYKLRGDVFLVETQRNKFRQLVESSRFESATASN